MTNQIYPKGLEGFAAAGVNWPSDDIRAILVDLADYTFSTAHDFLDDVAAIARVATMAASLANKVAPLGVCDADDVTYSAVTGDPSEAVIIYKHTGTDSTSRLLAYYDTATGLPVTPNGGNITITWDSGANKIFAI